MDRRAVQGLLIQAPVEQGLFGAGTVQRRGGEFWRRGWGKLASPPFQRQTGLSQGATGKRPVRRVEFPVKGRSQFDG